MYNGKTKISLRIVLFVIKVAFKYVVFFFFSHKSCLLLKGQNLLHKTVASSPMPVRVLPLCRAVSVGSVPEAAVGIRPVCSLFERGMRRDSAPLHCQWRGGVTEL